MEKDTSVIVINNENIDLKIRNVKGSKSIKIYIKSEAICINKPRYVPKKMALKMLEENKNKIYEMYEKERKSSISRIIYEDIDFLYNGEHMVLHLKYGSNLRPKLYFEDSKLIICLNENTAEDEKIDVITKTLKNFFKKKLDEILRVRISYYAKIMNLEYTTYSIKSMHTRFGSCNPKTKKLNFNINLIFMNEEVRDSIIVHELAHIMHPNHSKSFYNLVYKYSKNYDLCRKWIRDNHNYLDLIN